MAKGRIDHTQVSPVVQQMALLDYDGAARYLCTTPRHVRELWAKRYLAAIKVGRRVRFAKSDLDAFVMANRVESRR
jgi:excisionase family DNA binding protein